MGKQKPKDIDLSAFDAAVGGSGDIDLSAFDNEVKKKSSPQQSPTIGGSSVIGSSNPLNPATVRMPNNFNFAQQEDPETYNKVQAQKQQAKQAQSNRLSELNQVYDAAQGQGATEAVQQQAQNRPVDTLVDPDTQPYSGIGNNVAVGLNKAYEGLAKIPRFVYSAAAVPQNFLADQLDMPGLAAKYDNFLQMTNATPVTSPLTMLDQLGDYYSDEAEGYAAKTQKYDDTIMGSLNKGNFKQAGSQILDQIAESAPSIAVMAMTSGAGNVAGLSQTSKTLANALPFMSQRNAELQDDGSVPEWLKPVNAAANGLAEVVFDQSFGTQAAIQGIVNRFQNEGREAAVNAAKELTGSFLNGALKTVNVIKPFAKGAIEEASTQLAQNIVDKYTINPEKDLMEGVADAAIVGSAMTGGITTAANIALPPQRTQVRELEGQQQALLNELGNENLSPEGREAVGKIIEGNQATIESIAKETQEAISKLNPEQKKQVSTLNDQAVAAEAILSDPNASEEVKKVAEQQIQSISKEIDAIKPEEAPKEAVQETKTPEPTETTTEVKETIVEPEIVEEDVTKKSTEALEERWQELEDKLTDDESRKEFNKVEKELIKRERESIFNIPVEDVPDVINAMSEKRKSGTDTFMEASEGRRVKQIAEEYSNNNKENINDEQLIKDFIKGLRGNPDLDYADGLLVRESVKEHVRRGGDVNSLIEEAKKIYTKAGYSEKEAGEVVGMMIKKILKNAETTTVTEQKSLPSKSTTQEVVEEDIPQKGTEKSVDKKPVFTIKGETVTPKIKEETTDAVQKPSTEGVDVRQPSEDGSGVEQGNTQGQEVTGETGTQEVPIIAEEETLKSTPDKSTTGITLEQSAKNREELGLEAYEKTIKTDKELNRKADAALKEGYNITGLINRLQKGALPTDLEQIIARKYVSSLEAVNNKTPSNENIAKIREIRNALDTQRSELGRALRAGSGEILVEDNLSNFLMDEMDAIGVNELSESAINDLKAKYEKGQTAKEAYEEGYQKALDEFTKQQAELELAKVKKPRTSTGKKKTAAEYADERKSYKENIRRKLKEARSQANAVPIPYLNELIAISPEVAKLVKSYVEEGISKLDDIITKVHDDLKEDIEGITEEDVRDLIAGVYNTKRPTKDQISATLRDLRQQAKLLKRLDDLENGIQPKTERDKIQKSKSVESLQKQVKEIEDRVGITDEKSLKARRTSLENKIKQLKEDLEVGNFDLEPAQPRKLKLDPETQKAQDEYIEFLKETNKRRDQARYEQLSGFRKGWDKFHQILGLKRLVQTSLDFSMPFRQGIVIALNPRRYGIGFKNFRSLEGLYNTPSDIKNSPAIQSWTNMFKSTFSEKYYDRFMFQIKSDPQYRDMLEDKMIFSEVDSADNLKREEDFRTSFLYKIPYLNIPFLASNRAAAGFVNTARYELYKQGTVRLQEQGITRENSPESYKELAKWAMNATGRGNMLEFLENSPQGQRILGDTFYGARLMSSRFNLLNPNYYAKMPKEVRVEALKDMAGLASTIAVTLLAATAAGATVSLNPDDSDFLKAKWGNKRYDISGGMSQYMRTFFRLLKAGVLRVNPAIYGKNKDKGKLAYANKYGAFSVKAGVSFFRYKLAPNTSYVLSGLMGKDPLGDDFDPQEILNIYPMYTEDLKDALKKEDMATAGMTILIPNLFGIGVQEYGNEKKK